MNIEIVQGHDCEVDENCLVLVIDVLRAFTVSSYLYDLTGQGIFMVASKEDAFALKAQLNDLVLVGEIDALPIEGFDYGNSPSQLLNHPPSGLQGVMRTTNGVRTAINVEAAGAVFVVSFANARVTVDHILNHYVQHFSQIKIIATDRNKSDEDLACADYMFELLHRRKADLQRFIDRVRAARNAQKFIDENRPEFPCDDLNLVCIEHPRACALKVYKRAGYLVIDKDTTYDQ